MFLFFISLSHAFFHVPVLFLSHFSHYLTYESVNPTCRSYIPQTKLNCQLKMQNFVCISFMFSDICLSVLLKLLLQFCGVFVVNF